MPAKQPMNKEMKEREERVELFKTAATFGFAAAAMFCLGGPLILSFAPGLRSCFRQALILAAGVAGFLIVACVLVFYFLLLREIRRTRTNNSSSGPKAKSPR